LGVFPSPGPRTVAPEDSTADEGSDW